MKTPDKEKILASFKPASALRKMRPCRVRVNGQFVSVGRRNKIAWKDVGHAKNAIREWLRSGRFESIGYRNMPGDARESTDYVMDNWVGVGPDFPIEIVLM